MSAADYGFHPGEVEEGQPHELPQRVPGATLPADVDLAEAYRTRGARHIEMEEGR